MELFLITMLALGATWLSSADAGKAPRISKEGSVVKATPGKIVFMSCEAEGDPKPSIRWERDGKPITDFGHRFSLNKMSQALRIFGVEIADRGHYTCIAENRHGSDKVTNKLFVMIEPEAKIIAPTNLTFPELSNQELVCRSHGLPRPSFEWLTNHHQRIRANKTVDESSSGKRMYSVERQVGDETYESIITFQPITFKDFGQVACVAYNEIGTSRTTVALNVTFSPKMVSQHAFPQTVSWWEGHNTNLTCVVTGNDLPVVTWHKDGRPFKCNNLEESVDGTEITSSCVLKHSRDGGPGTYRCSAENKLGKILVHEFRVSEKFPPPAVEFRVIGSKPDEVTLSVKVPTSEHTPPATYVLASYQLTPGGAGGKPRPLHERMGDVNENGEAIVKLVGVKANKDYVVSVRARNFVGLGAETSRIVNTAITVSTTSKLSTPIVMENINRNNPQPSPSNDNDNDDDPDYEEDNEDGTLDDDANNGLFERDRTGRTAYAVMGGENDASSFFSCSSSLPLFLAFVCGSLACMGQIRL